MKKNINKALLVCALFSSFALSSCHTNPKPEPPAPYAPSEINVKDKHILLFVDEEASLNATSEEYKAMDEYVTYSSDDENVAKVDEHGTITAISAGETFVKIKVNNSDKELKVPVSVYDDDLTSRNRTSIKNDILGQQKERGENKMIKTTEYAQSEKFIEGKLDKLTQFEETLTISKDDAYLLIESYDREIKTEGGSSEYSYGKWVFYTTENYDTYIFHIDGSTKTYMILDTSSYIEIGSRYEALNAIIANIFTSGATLLNNTLKQGYVGTVFTNGKSPLDFITDMSFIPNAGSKGDGNLMFGLYQKYTDPVANDEEDDVDIPAGTEVTNTNTSRYYFDEYYCKYSHYRTTDEYELEEKPYLETTSIQNVNQLEGFELEYPNRDEYAQVYSIFDV